MTSPDPRHELLADADRCVKCGLCLPHCPTYAETRHEGDSPRGRIALLQGMASGLIPLTPAGERHLDTCLDCRSCEQVCPAQVPYGSLLDRGREWMARTRPARASRPRWQGRLFASRGLRRPLALLLWLYQRSGLSRLARSSARFRRSPIGRLEGLLPPLPFPRAPNSGRGSGPGAASTVQLFAGCMGDWAERDAAVAVVELLEAAGHRVDIPAGQQCCGALYLHAGLPAPARALHARNLKAFSGSDPIVTLASGCASGLRDIEQESHCGAAGFSHRLRDPLALLTAAPLLQFAPLDARIGLQLPCTQRLTAEAALPSVRLLQRIPGIEIARLAPARQCCGAAGSYFVNEPAMADRLLDATLDAIQAAGISHVVCANIGCRLHIAAGLRRRGLAIEVLHPAVLLRRQLRVADPRG